MSCNKIKSRLKRLLKCSTLNVKNTKNYITISVTNLEINIEQLESPIILIDLLAKYNKSNGDLTLDYDTPVALYKELTILIPYIVDKVLTHTFTTKVQKDNGESEFISVPSEWLMLRNTVVKNPNYKEWTENVKETFQETVQEVRYKEKIIKTFEDDFLEKIEAIEDVLSKKIYKGILNNKSEVIL